MLEEMSESHRRRSNALTFSCRMATERGPPRVQRSRDTIISIEHSRRATQQRIHNHGQARQRNRDLGEGETTRINPERQHASPELALRLSVEECGYRRECDLLMPQNEPAGITPGRFVAVYAHLGGIGISAKTAYGVAPRAFPA